MAKLKRLSAALFAAAVLATPAMARQRHVMSRHLAADASARIVPRARHVGWRGCYPAPRVGAFATEPWTDEMPCEPAPAY